MDQRLKNITKLLLECMNFSSCSTSDKHHQQAFRLNKAGRISEPCFKIAQAKAYNKQSKDFGDLEIFRLLMHLFGINPPTIYNQSRSICFQRVELEWNGGNLCFVQWSYNRNVTFTKEQSL